MRGELRSLGSRNRVVCVFVALALLGACGDSDGPVSPDSSVPLDGDAQSEPDAEVDADASDTGPRDDEKPDTGPDSRDPEVPDATLSCIDGDRDGVLDAECGGTDCDDYDAEIYPGAPELCANGVDDDCDPETPDEADADGDGLTCVLDCDDTDDEKPGTVGCEEGALFRWSFEDGPAGWEASDADGDGHTWSLTKPSGFDVMSAADGAFAWTTQVFGEVSVIGEQSFLTSPYLDMRGLNHAPILMFSMVRFGDPTELLSVEVQARGGAWRTLGAEDTGFGWYDVPGAWGGDYDPAAQWHMVFHRLDGVEKSHDVRIRFVFTSPFSRLIRDGAGIDDVRILPGLQDLAVLPYEPPKAACEDRDPSTVQASVINIGNRPFERVRLQYTVDDGAPVVEEIVQEVAPDQRATLNFATPAALSEGGEHEIRIAIVDPRDEFEANNATSGTAVTLATVTPDFFAEFEDGRDGYYAGGAYPSWGLGTPSGDYFSSAGSGDSAWSTGTVVDQWSRSEMSFLQSPCYDFSALESDPVLSFRRTYDVLDDGVHSAFVQLSVDGGRSWNELGGPSTGYGWYDRGHGWTGRSPWARATHLLSGAHDKRYVTWRFTVNYERSGSEGDGLAIDDVGVVPGLRDLSVEDPRFEVDVGCAGRSQDALLVDVWNRGTVSVTGFDVSHAVKGASEVVEHVNVTIPPGAKHQHRFVMGNELAAVGQHRVVVAVSAADDAIAENDERELSTITQPIVPGVGYATSFEDDDDGGWVARGFQPSWVRATPFGGAHIRDAFTGTRVWVTGASDESLFDEDSQLVSPCFDFSGRTTPPTLQFAHIYASDAADGRAWLEMSVDGGKQFTKVGSAGDANSVGWYDSLLDDTWSQTPNDDPDWHPASHSLPGAQGKGAVILQLRYVTTPDGFAQQEGHAIDDVVVLP